MSNHGGKRPGAGRKSKALEKQTTTIFTSALKEIYKTTSDDKAKIEFAKNLLKTQRGQIFAAEHLFGKSPNFTEIIAHREQKPDPLEEMTLEELEQESINILVKSYDKEELENIIKNNY